MELTQDDFEILNKILKQMGTTGIMNPVKIVIFCNFISGINSDTKKLLFVSRGVPEIQEIIKKILGSSYDLMTTTLTRIENAGLIIKRGNNYELAEKGKIIAEFCYKITTDTLKKKKPAIWCV